ncbi:RfbX Membrane protein involved in the export of O-antigen and teichoic acid [Methylophilaceae bacterium]
MNQAEDPTPNHNPMHRVLGNFWILIRGRGAAAIMAFGATALMARSLGPVEFGLVVLMHTYVMLIRALLDFGTEDAIVRFGVPAHDAADNHALGKLIKICRRIDKQSSLAAAILALFIAPFAGPAMGMDPKHVMLLMAYSTILLTPGAGSAAGLLRLNDRFDVLGRQMAIAPTIRFFGVAIAWGLGAPIEIFVAIWGAAYLTENNYLLWQAKHKYRTQINQALIGVNLNGISLNDFDGLRHFIWVTYWQSNLDLLPKHTTTLLVGYFLGPAEAGLLRLAREISSTLSRPSLLIRNVVLLDLTRAWHLGSAAFDVVAYRTALLGGIFGLAFVALSYFFGEYLLGSLLGTQFIAAKGVLTLMLLAATLDLASSPLLSGLYAMGHAMKTLRITMASTAVYLLMFVLLTRQFGLIGAGLAATAGAALTLVGMVMLMRSNKRAA